MHTPTRSPLPLQRIAPLQDRHFLLTEFFGGEPIKPFSSHELVNTVSILQCNLMGRRASIFVRDSEN